jgi:hypothetical protein
MKFKYYFYLSHYQKKISLRGDGAQCSKLLRKNKRINESFPINKYNRKFP